MPRLRLRPAPEIDDGIPQGVTPPSGRRGAGRFLTDVIVEMGFVDRGRVDAAIARGAGHAPERVLQQSGLLSQDHLAPAVAERYGLHHLDLNEFKVNMGRPTLFGLRGAPYEAVPVEFAGRPRARWSPWSIPRTCWRWTTWRS